MKTIEIICGIVAGGIMITWILYLAVRCLGNCRNYKDRIDRERDHEYYRNSIERHRMGKKL